jgi:hypothetical protein
LASYPDLSLFVEEERLRHARKCIFSLT